MARKWEFRKKNSERCGADAQTGKSLRVFHDPDKASEGHRARRAGGIKRSRAAGVLPPDTPDHPLGNPKQVSDLLADSVNRLRRGQLDPRVANANGLSVERSPASSGTGSNGRAIGLYRGDPG